jgi:flagella basal body P-ring formation protein FlgA
VILVSRVFLVCCIFLSTQLVAVVTKDQLKNSIISEFKQQFLKHHATVDSKDVRVVILNEAAIDDVSVTIGSSVLDLEEDIDVLGKTVRPVTLLTKDGHFLDKLQVVVLVEAKITYFKSSKRIHKGDIIRKDDFYPIILDMKGRPKKSIFFLEEIVGQQAAYAITAGTIITRRMVRDFPDVEVGDIITVFLVGENLELKIKGQALDEGYTGDTIRLKSDVHKKKMLKGEIIGPSSVQVFFAD